MYCGEAILVPTYCITYHTPPQLYKDRGVTFFGSTIIAREAVAIWCMEDPEAPWTCVYIYGGRCPTEKRVEMGIPLLLV
jgi:hypothetical protein